MGGESIDSGEFDWLMEIIAAILFMSLGILGIVQMSITLARQTEVNTRVDKVRVSSIDQDDSNPFVFTGYQAYMFAWMMDGHDETALMWAAHDANDAMLDKEHHHISDTYGSEGYILLDPAGEAAGFIVKRNRAIIGADEYEHVSVKNTLYSAASAEVGAASEKDLIDMYMGADGAPRWKLDLTDKHISDYATTVEYLDKYETQIFEERKDYIWTLHPCVH